MESERGAARGRDLTHVVRAAPSGQPRGDHRSHDHPHCAGHLPRLPRPGRHERSGMLQRRRRDPAGRRRRPRCRTGRRIPNGGGRGGPGSHGEGRPADAGRSAYSRRGAGTVAAGLYVGDAQPVMVAPHAGVSPTLRSFTVRRAIHDTGHPFTHRRTRQGLCRSGSSTRPSGRDNNADVEGLDFSITVGDGRARGPSS